MNQAASRLERIGAKVIAIELPPEFNNLTDAQRTIQAFEAARALSVERIHRREQLSGALLALIDYGLARTTDMYVAALSLELEA